MKPRVILFDLDGTLTDSAPGIVRCVEESLKPFGLTGIAVARRANLGALKVERRLVARREPVPRLRLLELRDGADVATEESAYRALRQRLAGVMPVFYRRRREKHRRSRRPGSRR